MSTRIRVFILLLRFSGKYIAKSKVIVRFEIFEYEITLRRLHRMLHPVCYIYRWLM